MISIQGLFLRNILRLRKAGMNWNAPIEQFRTRMEWSDRFVKLPRDVKVKSDLVSGIPVEWVIPANASSQSVILYIHGGAWTLGWTNLHRRMVMYLCKTACCRALAVEYRLAPEYPFPAALEDCLAVYHWLLKDGFSPQKIVIVGDSAGANLTLATLLALRDTGDSLPAAAVCISPMTDLAGTGESFRTNNDPALTKSFALIMAGYYAGKEDICSPLLSPHYADLNGLSPLLIQVGEDEILLSDATRLADNARADGIDVRLTIWPGMWHEWHLFAPFLPEARQAIHAVGAFVCERLRLQVSGHLRDLTTERSK